MSSSDGKQFYYVLCILSYPSWLLHIVTIECFWVNRWLCCNAVLNKSVKQFSSGPFTFLIVLFVVVIFIFILLERSNLSLTNLDYVVLFGKYVDKMPFSEWFVPI